MTTVLVVAAHPDDEVLGSGGALRRHVIDGDSVHVVITSEGATSRYADTMTSELAAAAHKSAEIIGFESLRLLSLPDQRLDAIPLIEVTQRIEELVQDVRPDVVYTHSPVDVNADHGVVARATWTACRPFAAPFVTQFLAFETPSSTEWAWPGVETTFVPQVFVDIQDTLETKLDAMTCYEVELRPYPHPRSIEALRERAAYWGSKSGFVAAEPFALLRWRV